MDHHPAKRSAPDERILLIKDIRTRLGDSASVDGSVSRDVPVLSCSIVSSRLIRYFSLGKGQAAMPPSMTLTLLQPLPSRALAAS